LVKCVTAECGMRKVKCGMETVERWCGTVGKMRNRDVKTVYFSEPVTSLLKPVFTGYRMAYCERDNCHQSFRACYQSIACCFTAAVPAFQTHGRLHRETKDSGVSKR